MRRGNAGSLKSIKLGSVGEEDSDSYWGEEESNSNKPLHSDRNESQININNYQNSKNSSTKHKRNGNSIDSRNYNKKGKTSNSNRETMEGSNMYSDLNDNTNSNKASTNDDKSIDFENKSKNKDNIDTNRSEGNYDRIYNNNDINRNGSSNYNSSTDNTIQSAKKGNNRNGKDKTNRNGKSNNNRNGEDNTNDNERKIEDRDNKVDINGGRGEKTKLKESIRNKKENKNRRDKKISNLGRKNYKSVNQSGKRHTSFISDDNKDSSIHHDNENAKRPKKDKHSEKVKKEIGNNRKGLLNDQQNNRTSIDGKESDTNDIDSTVVKNDSNVDSDNTKIQEKRNKSAVYNEINRNKTKTILFDNKSNTSITIENSNKDQNSSINEKNTNNSRKVQGDKEEKNLDRKNEYVPVVNNINNDYNEAERRESSGRKIKLILFIFFLNLLIISLLFVYTEYLCDCTVRFNKTAIGLLIIAFLPLILLSVPISHGSVNLSIISFLITLFLVFYLFFHRVIVRFYLIDTDAYNLDENTINELIKDRYDLDARIDILEKVFKHNLAMAIDSLDSDVKIIILHSKHRKLNDDYYLDAKKFQDLFIEDAATNKANYRALAISPVLGYYWRSGEIEKEAISIIEHTRYSGYSPNFYAIVGFFDINPNEDFKGRELFSMNNIIDDFLKNYET